MGLGTLVSLRVSGAGAALCLALAVVAPRPRCTPLSREDSERAIERSDRIALAPLDRFEKTWTIDDGRRALAAARRARELLEALCIPEALESAKREELTFFNHATLGLDAWLARRPRPDASRELGSILKRGRAHRERSREALRGTQGAETTREGGADGKSRELPRSLRVELGQIEIAQVHHADAGTAVAQAAPRSVPPAFDALALIRKERISGRRYFAPRFDDTPTDRKTPLPFAAFADRLRRRTEDGLVRHKRQSFHPSMIRPEPSFSSRRPAPLYA